MAVKSEGVLETFRKVAEFGRSLIAAVGILVVFYYCFYVLHFFPSGLTLGEGLLFAFAAIGFGLLYFFVLGLGFGSVYLLWHIWDEKLRAQLSAADKIFHFIGGLIFLAAVCFVAYVSRDVKTVLGLLGGGFLLLVATALWNESPTGMSRADRTKRPLLRLVVVLSAISTPLLLGAGYVNIVALKSIEGLGLSKKGVSLILSKENYSAVQAAAHEFKIPVFGCQAGGERVEGIVHGADVLWHGMGTRSLIQFESGAASEKADKKANKFFRVELDSSGVKLLQSIDSKGAMVSMSFKTCIDLNSDTLFDFYSSTLNSEGLRSINEFVGDTNSTLSESGLKVVSVIITGHTDLTPVKAEGDSNYELSNRRAKAVAVALNNLIREVPKDKIISRGKGAVEAKTKCDRSMSPAELNECRAPDRRVNVELLLERK